MAFKRATTPFITMYGEKPLISHHHTPSSSGKRTISEISDDIFLVKPDTRPSSSKRDSRKTYKEKISEHIKRIKERTSITSTDLRRGKIPVDRIREESQIIDAEIETVRNKFGRERESYKPNNEFFEFVMETKEDEGTSDEIVSYSLPESLEFTVDLAERGCFFNTHRYKTVDNSKKIGSTELTIVNVLNIPRGSKNILEQRFIAADDRRWFYNDGNLILLEQPTTKFSLRPSSFQTNESTITDYFPPNLYDDSLEEIVVMKENILEIYFSHLKFLHHPLFSLENIFVELLNSAYEEYIAIQERNVLTDLKNDLEELRKKRSKIKNDADLKKIDRDVKKIRNKYFTESKKYRHVTLTMLESWRIVKKIREIQTFSSTSMKLMIEKEPVQIEKETEEQNKMYEETLKELKREYRNELDDEKVHESTEEIYENFSQGNETNDNESNSSTEFSEIHETDDRKLRKNLRKLFRNTFKPPGEPKLRFSLNRSHPVTETVDYSREIARRSAISSTKFYLRILCNSIEACKTKFLNLTEDFELIIDETFFLQLIEIPKYLTVEVFAQPKSLLKKKVCEMNIYLPDSKNSGKNLRKNFEKSEIVHYKHEGVGSGKKLRSVVDKFDIKLKNIENFELKTCGYLEYSIEWEKVDKQETDTTFYTKMNILDQVMDKQFVIDYKKAIETLDSLEDDYFERSQTNNYFRLCACQNSLTFCNISEIEENIRLKVLMLRDKKEIEFDGLLVPNRIKEFPVNILSQYNKRKAAEDKESLSDEVDSDFKTQYNFGKKFLKQVHIKVFQMCKNTDNNLDYESVIDEKFFIYFHLIVRTIIRNILNWLRWKPKISKPLPVLQNSEYDEPQQINKSNLNINIIVVCAKNLPRRRDSTFNANHSTNNELSPYVEVNYKNLATRTSCSRGIHASWNEMLTIPLESNHSDYLSPNSLDGVVNINIFDESDTDVIKLNKRCRNWLGGIDILLSAICTSENMNGFFPLKIPYLLLDYEHEDKQQNKSSKMSNYQIGSSYLYMEISVHPNVPKLSPNMSELPSGDIPFIQEHILTWNRNYNTNYPHRKFNALVLDTNGKTTCVTRFIKPLEPPPINTEEFDVTAEQCIRYISLIPFTECSHFYNNIWLTPDQLIKLMLGTITDHAITLTCYLLALKIEAWLLLGYGIPHGSTAYVLIRDHPGDNPLPIHYIIDVASNEKYDLQDEHCPLQKIFCVIDGTNVWANTQTTNNVALTKFDFHQNSDWLPMFDNNISAPNNSMAKKIIYKIKEDDEVVEILLEKYLKRKFSKVRQLDKTIWNGGLSNVLTNVLKTFEMNCMYNKNHQETIRELNEEISQYKVSGLAMNVPFKHISELAKKIKKIGIHIQQETDVEFALGVYVHSYPGRLFSVWIFLVSVKNSD
ncbi:coiled-coil and C2 domain-containing protein 2A [Diorhabda sublineata]|uniref:coiled-coil and C2 domain-containing protein 2A n=1 Tax=Diorhabda sublineata TaxID=1163346 RepID=UPI0024E121DE|nr:coiled-coil and C2 domain-containing protein 2A [Diorhabda sublineata]